MPAESIVAAPPVVTAPPVVPRRKLLAPTLFTLAVLLLVGWGYARRHDLVLSAETGLGYSLGILGVTCMLLLLTYPLAKRTRTLQRLVPVRYWFRVHMMLGILGPVAILFHCNFQMGSLNSSVALTCMLLVVASGVIGRYFYSKVHLGLYGQKASGKALLAAARQQQLQLRQLFAGYPDMVARVDQFYSQLLPQNPENMSVSGAVLAAPRRWYYRLRFRQAIQRHQQADLQQLWRDSHKTLNQYLDTLRKLAQLQFFERLLSWWHILHMPFFIMMLITAVVHVWAVHRY